MANLQAITRDYVLRSRTEGVAETTAAAQRLGQATDSLATKTETVTKSSVGAAAALERHQRSLDLTYRAARQFETVQRDLDRAQVQGLISTARQSELLSLAAQKSAQATQGLDGLAAANDNVARAAKAANDNIRSSGSTIDTIGTIASHSVSLVTSLAVGLLAVAKAALTLHPAVELAATPAMIRLHHAATELHPALGATVGFIEKLLLPLKIIALVAAGYHLLKDAVADANERIERSAELVKKSLQTGLDTDMLQRIELAAKKAGLSIDAMTESFKKFKEASDSALGGSEVDKKLNELVGRGNFGGNSGTAAYQAAITTTEKYRAVLAIIREAMDKGERLAALDLAKTFATPEMLNRLRGSSDALDRAQEAAEKIANEKLIDPQQIAYALQLKKRLEEAEEILHEKWIPFHEVLVKLGLFLKNVWISILEVIAAVLDNISHKLEMLGKIAPTLIRLAALFPGPIAAIGQAAETATAQPPQDEARRALARGLLNPGAVEASGLRATEISYKVFGDKSFMNDAKTAIDYTAAFTEALNKLAGAAGDAGKEITQNIKLAEIRDNFEAARTALLNQNLALDDYIEKLKLVTVLTDAAIAKVLDDTEAKKKQANGYDTALQRVKDHIDEMRLEIEAVGKNTEAVHRLTTERNLERAALRAGVDPDKDKIKALAAESAATEQLLKMKRLREDIKFDRTTALMPDKEVEIARKLKDMFPDIATALASDEAMQMRFNAALKETNVLAGDFASGFLKDLSHGVAPMDALANGAKRLADNLIDVAGKKLSSLALGSMADALGLGTETAGMTAGATSAATILTSAGVTVAASIVAGATQAAGILGLTVPTAAATLPVAGAVTGTEVATGGVVAGTALATGGIAAGIAIWGPIAAIMAAIIAAAALAESFLTKEKREREDAAKLAKSNADAAALSSTLGGGGSGSILQNMTQMNLQVQSVLASFHGVVTQQGLQLFNDMNNFFVRVQKDFKEGWEASLAMLGDNSAFNQARANVATLAKTILDFVNNTRDLGTASQVSKAQTAGRDTLLAMIAAPAVLSDTATEIARVHGTAAGLQAALVTLGLSAADATAKINEGVSAALANLATNFTAGLTARLNTASGKSFLNDIITLSAQHAQDLADASALGLSQGLANSVFAAEFQKIIDDTNLIGAAFADAIAPFPELAGVVHEATAAIKDQIAAQSALNSAGKGVVDYISGLLGGQGSTLSPLTVLANAQSAYATNLAFAKGPASSQSTVDAANRFPQVAEDLRKAALAVYASSQGYQSIFQGIIADSGQLTAVTQTTDPIVTALAKLGTDYLAHIKDNTGTTATNVGATTETAGSLNQALGGTTNSVLSRSIEVAKNTELVRDQLFTAYHNAADAATNAGTVRDNLLATYQAADDAATNAAHVRDNLKTTYDNAYYAATNAGTVRDNLATAVTNADNVATNAAHVRDNLLTAYQNADGAGTNAGIVKDNLLKAYLVAADVTSNAAKVRDNLVGAYSAAGDAATNAGTVRDNLKSAYDNAYYAATNAGTVRDNLKTTYQAADSAATNAATVRDNLLTAYQNAATAATNAGSLRDTLGTAGGNANSVNIALGNASSGLGTVVGNTKATADNVGASDGIGIRAILKVLQDAFLSGQASTTTTTIGGGGRQVTFGAIVADNNVLAALNKIVINTYAIASNTHLLGGGNAETWKAGTYAAGGTIPPYALGLVSEHLNPTFLRAGSEPIHVFPGAPGNDNSAVVSEIRALRAEVAQLRRENNTMIKSAADAAHADAEDQIGAHDSGTKKVTEAIGMNYRDQRKRA